MHSDRFLKSVKDLEDTLYKEKAFQSIVLSLPKSNPAHMSVTVLGLPLCPGPCAPGRGLTGTNESNTTDFMKTSCQVYTLHTAHCTLYTVTLLQCSHTSNKDNIAPHPPKATRHRAKYLIKMPLHPPKKCHEEYFISFQVHHLGEAAALSPAPAWGLLLSSPCMSQENTNFSHSLQTHEVTHFYKH